jgi:nitroimidazol reductase NimA-like FMN-containing flavoprotein (pyridoxamine 5'-phosphate oxidase superfamily)
MKNIQRPMRRVQREVTDTDALRAILKEATVLFLSFHDEPAPYVIPVCFGHMGDTLYVHCAAKGTKMDLLAARPDVGFSASTQMIVTSGETACDFGCRAQSVVGTGRARIVETEEERGRGLDTIMRHYITGPAAEPLVYKPGSRERTCLLAIDIESLRGKTIP